MELSRQNISTNIQLGNAKSVLGTIVDSKNRDELFLMKYVVCLSVLVRLFETFSSALTRPVIVTDVATIFVQSFFIRSKLRTNVYSVLFLKRFISKSPANRRSKLHGGIPSNEISESVLCVDKNPLRMVFGYAQVQFLSIVFGCTEAKSPNRQTDPT